MPSFQSREDDDARRELTEQSSSTSRQHSDGAAVVHQPGTPLKLREHLRAQSKSLQQRVPSPGPPPAATKPAAAPAAAPKPSLPPGAAYRTNVTIAVMALCIVLIILIAAQSGRNSPTPVKQNALVFLLDGEAGPEMLQTARRFSRVPFLAMLEELGAAHVANRTTNATSDVMHGVDLAVRALQPAGSDVPSVIRRAAASGVSVAQIGSMGPFDKLDGGSCVGESSATGCPAASPLRLPCATAAEAYNATKDARFGANDARLIVTRLTLVSAVDDHASCAAQHLPAMTVGEADALIGRATMAALERTAADAEALLVVVAYAGTGESTPQVGAPTSYTLVVAFDRDQPIVLRPMVNGVPERVASTIAQWFALEYDNGAEEEPLGICSSGINPTLDCTQ